MADSLNLNPSVPPYALQDFKALYKCCIIIIIITAAATATATATIIIIIFLPLVSRILRDLGKN